jgi:hypothetical protein
VSDFYGNQHLFWFFGHFSYCGVNSFVMSLFPKFGRRLVKQIRVVIKKFLKFLVETVGSRILTERLCHAFYRDIFRYYPLNRTVECCRFVPACRLRQLTEIKSLNQGVDHARINSFLLIQQIQSKYALNASFKHKVFVFSILYSTKKYYTCKTYSNCINRDGGTNSVVGQDAKNKRTASPKILYFLKEEICQESKCLSLLLVKSIDKSRWSMSEYNKNVRFLVKKRQKYLALLSNKYGLHSIAIMRRIEE